MISRQEGYCARRASGVARLTMYSLPSMSFLLITLQA